MTSKRTKQQWLDILGQQEKSGLSVAEFCRTQNIKPKNFYYHSSKRLRTIADDNTATVFVRATMARNNAISGNLGTRPIHLQHKQSELSLPATISPAWLAALMVALV